MALLMATHPHAYIKCHLCKGQWGIVLLALRLAVCCWTVCGRAMQHGTAGLPVAERRPGDHQQLIGHSVLQLQESEFWKRIWARKRTLSSGEDCSPATAVIAVLGDSGMRTQFIRVQNEAINTCKVAKLAGVYNQQYTI